MTLHAEPTVAPLRINATALTAFEMQVSWDPIQHLSTNGILQGYEVRTCTTPAYNICDKLFYEPWSKVVHYEWNRVPFGTHLWTFAQNQSVPVSTIYGAISPLTPVRDRPGVDLTSSYLLTPIKMVLMY